MTMNSPTKIISRLTTALLLFVYACNALIARRYHGMVNTRESKQLMQAVGITYTVLTLDQLIGLALDGARGRGLGITNVGRLLLTIAMYIASWRFWSSFVDDQHGNIAHGETPLPVVPVKD